jgi:signal transduction histidine kinase
MRHPGQNPPAPAGRADDERSRQLARDEARPGERRALEALERRVEELEAALRHADRLATIGQEAAAFVHELSEPLATILGFTQLALKAEHLPTGVASDLGRVVDAALHAREIVRRLMLFARPVPTLQTAVDLDRVVDEALAFVAPRCAQQGVRLVRDTSGNLPPVTADPAQLQQVLVNLAVNALQAMPSGGLLTVRTAAGDRHVSLVVEDSGAGMSDDVRERIFEPFFTTRAPEGGTGLGLTVVHAIVGAHGGEIGVASQPGRGSRFEVRLPRREDDAGGASP